MGATPAGKIRLLPCASTPKAGGGRIDAESETFIVGLELGNQGTGGNVGWHYANKPFRTLDTNSVPGIAHALRADGFDASEDGTGRGTPLVPVLNEREDLGYFQCDCGDTFWGYMHTPCPGCGEICAGTVTYSPVAIHGTQDPCIDEEVAFALGRNSGQENAIAFSCKDHGADAGELAPTLRSMTHDGSHANRRGQVAICLDINKSANEGSSQGIQIEHTNALRTSKMPAVSIGMAVRRLTPVECERLQGFPDNYTNIPGAADGPRYKALGNSMARPVMFWIGRRIKEAYAHPSTRPR